MNNIIFHLSTCNTCQKIIKELDPGPDVVLQNIKTEAITAEQIDELKAMAGSYEALFSRRSQKFKAWGLKDKTLGEDDFRKLILEEYTFLKRPVMVINGQIFIGNARKEVEGALGALGK